jgi:hypothetical protein
VHGIGDLLGRVGSHEHLVALLVQVVEDEGKLQRMACAKASLERRWLLGEFVHVGGSGVLPGMGIRQQRFVTSSMGMVDPASCSAKLGTGP